VALPGVSPAELLKLSTAILDEAESYLGVNIYNRASEHLEIEFGPFCNLAPPFWSEIGMDQSWEFRAWVSSIFYGTVPSIQHTSSFRISKLVNHTPLAYG